MEWLRRAWRGFVAQAHALGAVYYAWVLLSTLVTGVYSIYKQLTTPAIQGESEWFFIAFVVGVCIALVLAPLLIAAAIRASSKGNGKAVANPTLAMKSRVVRYDVTPTSVIKRQTMTFLALDRTEIYRFHLAVTGIAVPLVTLASSGATLAGPTPRTNGDSYEVQFSSPLEKGQVATISVEFEVQDPGKTMRPFLSDRFTNCASYGGFDATYVFSQKPKSIVRERQNVAGETLESNNQLHTKPQADGYAYSYSVARVDTDCIYCVSWVW